MAAGGCGGLGADGSSLRFIEGCRFEGNLGGVGTTGGAGAIELSGANNVSILSTRFIANEGGDGLAMRGGPGAILADSVRGIIMNCLMVRNRGGDGLAMAASGPGGLLVSGFTRCDTEFCTIVANLPGSGGAPVCGGYLAFETTGGFYDVRSCIIRGNAGPDFAYVPSPLPSPTAPRLSHSNISGGTGSLTGTAMIDSSSLAVNAAAGDFRLLPASPSRDTGARTAPQPEFDLDGNPRIVNGLPDMGCFEANIPFLPGSEDDLSLEVLIGGASGFDSTAGSTLTVRLTSPSGGLVNAIPLILVQPYLPTAAPTGLGAVGLPQIHIDPLLSLALLDGTQPSLPFGPQIIGGGITLQLLDTGVAAGASVRFQAAALSPNASNGSFATSGAIDIVLR